MVHHTVGFAKLDHSWQAYTQGLTAISMVHHTAGFAKLEHSWQAYTQGLDSDKYGTSHSWFCKT